MEKHSNSSAKKILAIETSGPIFSLALSFLNGAQIHSKGTIHMDLGLRHSSVLQDGARFLLEHSCVPKKELTHLAVSTGPGSFTGLRVGIAYARALAQGLQIPLLGIPTFEVIARALRKKGRTQPLAILVQSIAQEVFAIFLPPGTSYSGGRPIVLSPASLCKKIRRPTIFAGDGFLQYEKEIRSELRELVLTIPQEENFPHAQVLAEIACMKIQKNKPPTISWEKVVPLYLRPPLAVERTLAQRKKQ